MRPLSSPTSKILGRGVLQYAPTSPITSMQSQVDGLVSHFVEEAASPTTLAAMVAGGMAYRLGRVGIMGLHVGAYCNTPLRVASIAVGLGSEVTAFELTSRTLQTVGANLVFAPREGGSQGSPLPSNLWAWGGAGGWREGLLHSLVTFEMLKGAGHLAREQNLVFQHVFQSTAMVAGHHTAGLLEISPHPEGSLAEQFLHAEATNLQLGAGMGLVHALAPGISAVERRWDLSVGAGIPPPSIFVQERAERSPPLREESYAMAAGSSLERPLLLMMSRPRDSKGTGSSSERREEGASLSLPALLRRLRAKNWLKPEDVVERLKRDGFQNLSVEQLRRYEGGVSRVRDFFTLAALARVYQTNLNSLIESSNRTRFPDLDPKLWETPDSRLYLEDVHDRNRLEEFRKKDPQGKTIGWVLYSGRKNPQRYFTSETLAEATGLGRATIDHLIAGRFQPEGKTLQALSRALEISESRLIDATNYTFYRSLLPVLAKLFPGRSISLDRQSDEARRVEMYARSPGSLGEILFAHRKSLPGFPSAFEMARRIGEENDLWWERELNRRPFSRLNLNEWVWLFQRAGIPLEALHPHLRKIGLTPHSPVFLVAQALRGKTLRQVAEESGIDLSALSDLIRSPGRISEAETLMDLKRALPLLAADRIFLGQHPEFASFFPEAKGERPSLSLSPAQIQEAAELSLGEIIFAQRMDKNWDQTRMSRHLGLSRSTLRLLEKGVLNLQDEKALQGLAEKLSLNPRLLSLQSYPQVLQLFEVKDPQTGQGVFLSPSDQILFQSQIRRQRSTFYLRQKLEALFRRRGLKTPEDLSRLLGLKEPEKADRFLNIHLPLSDEDLSRLKGAFPKIEIREWYEHFHRPELAYFLGQEGEGKIRWALPEGMTGGSLETFDMTSEILRAISGRFPSFREAAQVLGKWNFRDQRHVSEFVSQGDWSLETMALLSRELGLDRRLLYLYDRRKILKNLGFIDERRP